MITEKEYIEGFRCKGICQLCSHTEICYQYQHDNKDEELIKTPVSILPRHVWIRERLENIKRCIKNHSENNLELDLEWIKEYNELIKQI